MPAASSIIAGTAAAATVAGGIAQATAGTPNTGGRPLELPPELEEKQLAELDGLLEQVESNVAKDEALADSIAQRIDTLDSIAAQATPDPEDIKRLNEIDQGIAERFGKEIAKDVQAGIITEEAKRQATELQGQIADELTAQGKNVDDALLEDIQSQIRNRLSPSSPEAQAIDEVRNSLLAQVRSEGDVLQRDPRVEAELEKQKNQLVNDLANRGIDPNSTAGRRALQEFNQGATETRFSTSEQLATNRTARLSQLASGVLSTTESADLARSRALEQAIGTQQLASNRISRLQQLGQAIDSPVQSAILAGEPERLRRAEEGQRAGVALAASQSQREALAGGVTAQANLQQLRNLPSNIRARIIEQKSAGLQQFLNLGAQKFSTNTKRNLVEGSIKGFDPRTKPKGTVSQFGPLDGQGALAPGFFRNPDGSIGRFPGAGIQRNF